MTDPTTTQCVLFPGLFKKKVVARFDQHHGSSDGGALLLTAANRRLGLVERVSGCLEDGRQPGKIVHELEELVAQRVYALACGYPDGNDAARLAHDPIHKMLVGRDPIDGDPLASQPTLSRFENSVGSRELVRASVALAESVIARHRHRLRGQARRVIIDMDGTDDPTHGQQQLSFFNGYYDTWCYQPLLGFVSFNDEPDQYLFAAMLRPGNASPSLGALGMLRRIVPLIRKAFPDARIMVRLDAGFATSEIFDLLDEQPKLDYVVAMAGNKRLKKFAHRALRKARKLSRATGQSERVYDECPYAARSWSRTRRIIIKAEVTLHPGRDPKDNPRYVVTNLRNLKPRTIYEKVYCPRGDVENRIKELHDGMRMDLTSCPSFRANQWRLILTAIAYVLMQELRLQARRTRFGRAQVTTLREHLLKLGARVVVSVRRVVVHLPASFPFCDAWSRVAFALGAKAG